MHASSRLPIALSVVVLVACTQPGPAADPARPTDGNARTDAPTPREPAEPTEPAESADSGTATPPARAWSDWVTAEGADPSADRIGVWTPAGRAKRWALSGRRTVERVTTGPAGGHGTVVLSGSEPEADRTLRVALPQGARLDLQVGESVEVEAESTPRGLGHRTHVLVTRGDDLVVLSTERDEAGGVRVTRGAEAEDDSAGRLFGVDVRIGSLVLRLAPNQLARVASPPVLVQGSDRTYGDERVRPSDAFDARVVTVVRIRDGRDPE